METAGVLLAAGAGELLLADEAAGVDEPSDDELSEDELPGVDELSEDDEEGDFDELEPLRLSVL